ncbi:biotin carboxylase N-terminal domain-containing protein [Klebsiella sp. BIGb0407]|uniref:acetyl/propionyl/methylcrotonyl-CoA carboxylase subunit alpha n=1 Tax=Klebsiella sp. BIGb0407 TaxID=2940603 RepID=UPI002169038F|nr:biotin carboxylase N-terminal domain-containing protein [Klebsiella sp. BIGb0407]MCS3431813.1 acetyl-CoA/propionyl-CoA carboxylase biotin carboxyl carrier protein [Klebsiella sp. BIGb0407]
MTHTAHKVLIANRGEIAVRIIRACRDYGVQSVAVYARPDSDALHVKMADEAWLLEGDSSADTYLNIGALLDIASRSGTTMVHPGYGFLSERAEFARAVQAAGLIWIGPAPETIERLGDKVQARKIALAVGAPLVTGTAGPVSGAAEVVEFATQHGLPIAIKAAFGGGGRGLKIAWKLDEVAELYHSATREALSAFGRGECYVEQFIDRPRHIEAQVIADNYGNIVVLGTRDCSLQRRNQKLVEEAPAPFTSDTQREQIHRAAEDICRYAGYTSAGTVEFLLGQDGLLSFLEVNTRLQVEHPVTEEVTGLDIVVEQLRIADGQPLSIQKTPVSRGHAFEFRINAEDPGKGYLPTPGKITAFHAPSGPGVRLDSGVETGSSVPGHYDSLMAKLIITGQTREQAISRARRALREFRIEGVASVLPFHRAVMADPDFTENFNVHTRWIETDFTGDIAPAERQKPASDDTVLHSWIELDGRRVSLGLPSHLFSGLASHPGLPQVPAAEINQQTVNNAIDAPVTGQLFRWLVSDGELVQAGDIIAIMEAMKMEVQVIAGHSGELKHLATSGSQLQAGDVLGEIN